MAARALGTEPPPEIPGFEDLDVIGRGGFSTVFRAYQPSIDRHVAIKVLNRSTSTTGLQVRELQAVTPLGAHPNIGQVLDVGRSTDGRVTIAMPLYSGGSLGDRIDEGPITVDEALRVGVKIAGALAAAHAAGIVHGDVKPRNILFTEYGDPVLMDFGAATLPAGRQTDAGADEGADDVGFTIAYAAPEIFDGAERTPAVDVYSLALTLATAVGAYAPTHSGSPIDAARERLAGVRLSDVFDPRVRSVLEDALSDDPAGRPTALDFGERLRDVQRALGLQPTSLTGPSAAPSTERLVAAAAAPDPSPTWPPAAQAPPVPPPVPAPAVPIPPMPVVPAPIRPDPAPPGHTTIVTPAEPAGSPPTAAAPKSKRRARRTSEPSVEPTSPAAGDALTALLADRATSVDRLGNRPLVEGLSRLLEDPGTALPLSVAVTGRWGSGKSSTMLQLKERLIDPPTPMDRKWVPVDFDLWRYEGRDHIWIGLAQAIYEQTLLAYPTRRQRWRLRWSLLRRRHGPLRLALAAAVGLMMFAWLGVVLAGAISGEDPSILATVAALAGSVATVASLAAALRGPFSSSIRAASVRPRYDEKLGLTARAERDIDNLVESIAAASPESALVVFLDDLDRCTPTTIRETLVTISEVFARRPGDAMVFVAGVDLDIVTSVIESELAHVRSALATINPDRSGLLGPQFVEKVFQLQIGLESGRRAPIERLITASDGSADDERREEFLEQLRSITDTDVGHLTLRRREIGLHTVEVPREDLSAFRAAIRSRRSELLLGRASEITRAEHAILRATRLSPRAAKRFDNTYRLQLQVAANTPANELDFGDDQLLALAKLTAMRMFYPRLHGAISASLGLWEQVEETASRDAPDEFRALLDDAAVDAADLDPHFVELVRLGLPGATIRSLPLTTFAIVS